MTNIDLDFITNLSEYSLLTAEDKKELQLFCLNENIIILQKQEVICFAINILKKEELLNKINLINKIKYVFESKIKIIYIKENDFINYKKNFLETHNHYNKEDLEIVNDEDIENIEEILKTDFDLLSQNENSSPIIKLLNSIIVNAIKKGSSDIHLESKENNGEVRLRINGTLETFLDIDKRIMRNLSNRIKFLSLLNISERKNAQDGEMTAYILNESTDIRVSIIPTYYGERIVMRLLSNTDSIRSMQELNFSETDKEKLTNILNKSFGIFLIAGPTGSGKTTTLHSFLKEKSNNTINIITVEDPIEYKTKYANQIQVGKEHFSFNNALRAVLRQDPDVLMIGEIRDNETAAISIKASLTGHFVLSSIHANDTISCISRLIEMGVDKYLLKDSILGILSQRLVRIKCDCNKAEGCEKCSYTTYSHREMVYELLMFDESIKENLNENFTHEKIKEIAKKEQNFIPMKDKIDEMLKNGVIDEEEYTRIGL